MAMDLRLNGDSWQGTYATVVLAACADLLSDGEPIPGVTFFVDGFPTVDNVSVIAVRDDVIVARTARGDEVIVKSADVTRILIP